MPLGPGGSIIGAAVGPVIDAAVDAALDRLGRRVMERPGYVLDRAAKIAGIHPRELEERLAQRPETDELLIRVVRAAMEAAQDERLVALALSLAKATEKDAETTFEMEFVAAVGGLSLHHFRLLERFTWTARDLGQTVEERGPQLRLDEAPDDLETRDLERVFSEGQDVLRPVLSGLERFGLIQAATLPAWQGEGRNVFPLRWQITAFGKSALQRFQIVQELLEKTHH
jgi:hypothetical protein